MQSNTITEHISKRITALRFLLMILVVFIHNNFTDEEVAEYIANSGTVILFNQSAVGKWIQFFISEGIARAAVPLFFLFAAYLQAKQNKPYPYLLKKKIKTLFIPFILWTGIYIFFHGGLKLIVLKIAPQFLRNPEKTLLVWSAQDWFYNILGYKAKIGGDLSLPGIAYQFWFIRDLIILTVLSPCIMFLIRKYSAAVFFILSILYITVPHHLYFIRTQALFFYTAGLYWGVYNIPLFEKIDSIGRSESFFLFSVCFIIWKLFPQTHSLLMERCTVLSACMILIKLSSLIVQKEKIFKASVYLADFSFFLFAIHTPILNETLKRIWLHFFPMKNGFFCLFEYFGVTILTIFVGTVTGFVLKKICPPIFNLLTGGR